MLARRLVPLVALLAVLVPTAAWAQPAALAVDDATPNAGQTVNASGTGCAAAEVVRYELDERPVASDGRTDAAGAFAANILIPETTTVARHTLSAECGARVLAATLEVGRQGAGELTVGPRLNPRQGETVQVNGTGCRTQADVGFLVGTRAVTPGARSDNAGRFQANVLIAMDTPIGATTVTARCGSHSLSRQIEVLAAGSQVGQVPSGGVQTGVPEDPAAPTGAGTGLVLAVAGLVMLAVPALRGRLPGRSR